MKRDENTEHQLRPEKGIPQGAKKPSWAAQSLPYCFKPVCLDVAFQVYDSVHSLGHHCPLLAERFSSMWMPSNPMGWRRELKASGPGYLDILFLVSLALFMELEPPGSDQRVAAGRICHLALYRAA